MIRQTDTSEKISHFSFLLSIYSSLLFLQKIPCFHTVLAAVGHRLSLLLAMWIKTLCFWFSPHKKYKQSTIPITQEVSNWSHIPGIAWMIMCGMELLKLLPCKVRNTQWISTRNYTVSVIRKDFVLQVLCKYSLIICLNRKTSHFSKSHQNTF